MEKELKDKSSPFYIYKSAKLKNDKFASESKGKDRITADDIAWYLGKVWERSKPPRS